MVVSGSGLQRFEAKTLTRRLTITWLIILAAIFAAAAIFPDRTPGVRGFYMHHKLVQELQLPDPERRKQAAWDTIRYPSTALADVMIRGLLGHEPDPDVRESYAYVLGNLHDLRAFAALERAVDTDESGYVRCSAWLAIVRLDPEHFRTLAAAGPRYDDPWDRLGLAQAWLSIGDTRGLTVLFEEARSRDETRRIIAYRAMTRWLKPALDSVGRWPLDFQPRSGQDWPTEWLEEIERRCASLDIMEIADRTHNRLADSTRVRRNIRRINGARENLIRFLFAPGEALQ